MARVHDDPIRVGRIELRHWREDLRPSEQQQWCSLKWRGRRGSYVLKRLSWPGKRSQVYVLWVNR